MTAMYYNKSSMYNIRLPIKQLPLIFFLLIYSSKLKVFDATNNTRGKGKSNDCVLVV